MSEDTQDVALDETIDTPTSEENSSQPETETEAHEEESETVSKEDYERLQNKARSLETNYAETQKNIQTYNNWILQDEARTRDYLKSQNMSDNEVETAIQQIIEKRPDLWKREAPQEQPEQKPQVQFDPQKIKQDLKQEIAQEEYINQERSKFFETVPEMNPSNFQDASPEDLEIIRDFANRVDFMAQSIMQTSSTGYSDALIKAYNFLLQDDQVSEAKEEGRLEGLAKVNADNASNMGNYSPNELQSKSVDLSQAEMDIADATNVSYEEYAKYKRERQI